MPLPLGEIVASVLHDADGDPIDSLVFSDNVRRLAVSARLENADISIGAVEIKDGNTDQRADVENADASGDFASTLNGLVVNARTAVFVRNDSQWGVFYGDRPSQVSGIAASGVFAAYTNAINVGVDNTGATVMRPVEARSFDAAANVSETLIGLLVNSRSAYFNNTAANWAAVPGDSVSATDGVSNNTFSGPWTLSQIVGEDSPTNGVGVMRAVIARGLSTIDTGANTLIALLVGASVFGRDLTAGTLSQIVSEQVDSVSGQAVSSWNALGTVAFTAGVDNTGAAVSRTVEARNFDAVGDVAATLIGLLVNSRLSAFDLATNDWSIIPGDLVNNVSGRSGASVRPMYTNSVIVGLDNTGAAVLRPVEARDIVTDADLSDSLIGLLVNSRCAIFDSRTGGYARLQGTSHLSPSGDTRFATKFGAYIYEARESAFAASRDGARFYATHQTPDTVITGQTAFAATTPTFLLRQNATSVRVVLRSITLHQTGTVAGGEVKITVAIDTADRFSAGGTSVTPQNANEESATASGITSFLTNPTATAAGAGTRYLVNTGMAASVGSTITIEFKDGVLLSATSALLVYTWAATTGPSWFFTFEWEEVV